MYHTFSPMGAAAYRQIGSEQSPGSKLFCVSGDAARPGLYELPFGITIRELLDMAGGIRGGGHYKPSYWEAPQVHLLRLTNWICAYLLRILRVPGYRWVRVW